MTPPYAADTRAKGWRFELDYEKIEQSDTWSIAAEVPMAQPALLMMWFAAWKQEPCGSLPSDENAIRAKCRIPPKQWAILRPVLMRGWQLADDGRFYHPTITARVLEMLDYRKKTAERVATFKAKQREQHGGNALPTEGVPVKNDTGTGTGTIEKKEKEKRPRRARATPLPEPFVLSVRVETWAATKGYRPEDVAAQTEVFLSYVKRKGATYVDWDEAVMTAIREDWAKQRQQPAGETAYQRSMRERVAEIHPALARPAPGQTQPNPMEVLDGLITPLRIAR